MATYTALKRQGTPVSLVWQSWGHSDSSPASPASSTCGTRPSPTRGAQALAWFDYYVRGRGAAPAAGLRATTATGCTPPPATTSTQAYADARQSYPVGTHARPGTSRAARPSVVGGAVVDGTLTLVAAPASTIRPGSPTAQLLRQPVADRTELHRDVGARPDPPGDRPAGHRRSASPTPPLARPLDVVGSPRLTVQLDAPTVAAHPGGGPGRTARGLRQALRRRPGRRGRAAAPADLPGPRSPTCTQPVTIELPAIVHRFEAGHRLGRRPRRRRHGLPRLERPARRSR